MTNKYIIKNCPAILTDEDENMCCDSEIPYCKDITDCLLKQMFEKCKEEIRANDRWSDSRAFATEILQLLEIQECE